MENLKILTEYEFGRSITSIEWVARSEKPIVELGSRTLSEGSESFLASDVNRCIETSREPVKGFTLEEKPTVWIYGFFSKQWAIDALLFLRRGDGLIDDHHCRWVSGLLFGYGADSIQRFITESGQQASKSQPCCTVGRVEMFPLQTEQFRSRNNQPAKCQTRG